MSTPKVDYVYADGSANTVRREGYVQPNGQPVEYLYDYPAGDNLSRVGSLVVGAPADGLRAFWKLDENVSSGPRQDSVGNDTLTDANNNVGVETGLFGGQAALFDATAATALYTYPTPPNLEFGNQDFTTSGWIKYTSFPGVGGTIGAWGNGNAGNANPLEQEWILYVLRTDKHLRWLVSDGTHYGEIDSGVAVAPNTWYFVVAWYDAAQGRIYVQVNNGTPAYASYAYGPSARNRGFALGRTNDNFMSGLIQNVGVWDRVLTADERTALYNSGSGVQFFNHARYSYLGASAPVVVDYLQPQVQSNLATGSGAGTYAGLDRFGRVIDNRWQTMASSPSDVARQQYGYDRASNRLWREDPVAKAQSTPKYFDELYNYDAVYRLTGMQRGQLTGTPPSGVSNKNFAQGWNLDPTGNWKGFTEAATGGSNTLVQTRTANPVNEITDITNTTGAAWAQPGYDAAGNMTSVPQPADMSATYQAKYDAWNRLVELRDPATGNLVQVNQYDGLTRRTVQQTFDSSGTLAEERHYYYSDSWQVLEERVGSTPVSAAPDRRYVWGLRYIDDLVLRDRSISGGTLNERLFALQDANWNVVALCDAAGAVQQRFAYSPYGVPLFLNADFTTGTNSKEWETLFCGYRWEGGTGMYLVRFRALNSVIGSWLSQDPLNRILIYDSVEKRMRNELNLFQYVQGRPFFLIDPLGLETSAVERFAEWQMDHLRQAFAPRMEWYSDIQFASDRALAGDCGGECEKFTILVKLPSIHKSGGEKGHTSIAAGPYFYDFGPGISSGGRLQPSAKGLKSYPSTAWWGNPENFPTKKIEEITLNDVLSRLPLLADESAVVKFEICVSPIEIGRCQSFWNRTREVWPEFSVPGCHCTSAVISSMRMNGRDAYKTHPNFPKIIVPMWEGTETSPERFAKELGNEKHLCGPNKGKRVVGQVIKSADEEMAYYKHIQKYLNRKTPLILGGIQMIE